MFHDTSSSKQTCEYANDLKDEKIQGERRDERNLADGKVVAHISVVGRLELEEEKLVVG